jgi:hypothetical protein
LGCIAAILWLCKAIGTSNLCTFSCNVENFSLVDLLRNIIISHTKGTYALLSIDSRSCAVIAFVSLKLAVDVLAKFSNLVSKFFPCSSIAAFKDCWYMFYKL